VSGDTGPPRLPGETLEKPLDDLVKLAAHPEDLHTPQLARSPEQSLLLHPVLRAGPSLSLSVMFSFLGASLCLVASVEAPILDEAFSAHAEWTSVE